MTNDKYIDDEKEKNLDEARHLKKLTVDDAQDEQDFRIEDEVTEDSAEQIEAKQYPRDQCEYDAKYLNNLKMHTLAQHEGFKSSCDQS